MSDTTLDATRALISVPFDLNVSEIPDTEAALLELLSERIAEMLERQPEYLMSLLYRIDVLEEKIIPVLAAGAPEPPHIGLARLVLERQKQRVATKKSVKVEPLEGWDL
jgi:hypothetical protein